MTDIKSMTLSEISEALRAMGIPFRFDARELEHGQPFASLDEAVQFFRIYSKDEAPGAVTPEAVLPRMQAFYDDPDALIFGCAGLKGILPAELHSPGLGLFLFGEVCTVNDQAEFGNLMLSKLRITKR